MRRLIAALALVGATLAAPLALTMPAHAVSAQWTKCPEGEYWTLVKTAQGGSFACLPLGAVS